MHIALTCAVTPNVEGTVTLADPTQRLEQYSTAIRAWAVACDAISAKLAILETTGFGAAQLAQSAGVTRALCVDYQPDRALRAAGKGAVEAASIDQLVDVLPSAGSFAKVTGRLMISNATAIMRAIVDEQAIYLRMCYGKPWADTRLFAMSTKMWRARFSGVSARCDDRAGRYLEHEIGRCAHIALAEGVPIARFAQRPRWRGVSGSTGRIYADRQRSPSWAALNFAERHLARLLAAKQL